MVQHKKRILGLGLAAAGFFIIVLLIAGAAMGGDGGRADDCIADLSGSGNEGEGGDVLAALAVTSSINYQGRLTDNSGNPLNGTYTMTFKLYENATGGTALATDTHSVTVTDGLFSTTINIGTSAFDGRALWLGIKVGSDPEMTPRQELKPVPYALSLRGGANIIYGGYPALHAESTHPSGRGLRGYATATSGTNYGVVGASKSPDGYGGYFYNNGGGIGLYGMGKYGVYGEGNETGGYFTTTAAGTLENQKPGVNVSTQYEFNPGVFINTTGDLSDGVYASTTGYQSDGVSAFTYGDASDGVSAFTSGNHSDGVYASTSGNHSDGVYASTFGPYSDGVYASASGYGSAGIKGFSDQYYGGMFGGAGNLGIYVIGNIEKTGSVSFVEDHPTDPIKEIVYVCLEGGETGTYTRGSAQLINGEAVILLPEHFSMVTSSEGLTVQVTPTSDCNGLYIVSKSPTELVVKELNGGTSEATFDYLMNGVRKGYEEFQPIRDKQEMTESGDLVTAPEHLEAEPWLSTEDWKHRD